MTEDDLLAEQPEHKAGMAAHVIRSAISDLAEMIAQGQVEHVKDVLPSLRLSWHDISNICTYLELHRRAA